MRKIVAAMPAQEATAAHSLATKVRFLTRVGAARAASIPTLIEEAVVKGEVLRLGYLDRLGAVTDRTVEPTLFLAGVNGWYLVAWCRLRGSQRMFRLDRITAVEPTGELAAPRVMDPGGPPRASTWRWRHSPENTDRGLSRTREMLTP
ncbi:hypothetical protein GCM10029964_094290 [Kibdelosporangium lantanae]